MNLAHFIVSRLLNEEHFDVLQRPDLYRPTGATDPKGRKVYQVCTNCEVQYGADKQYPPDVSVSHGICRRHYVSQMVSQLGFTPDAAAAKYTGAGPVDWQEVLGGVPSTTPSPKATFWATSGSGGV